MQNANILNLPENYTFKYCECYNRADSCDLTSTFALLRPVSRPDMARAIIRCSQPQRRDRRVHSREDVSTTTSSDGAHLTEGFTAVANRDEEAVDTPSGHVTSISVLRPYRRLGLANKLMRQSRKLSSIQQSISVSRLLIPHRAGIGREIHGNTLQCRTYHLARP